MNVSPSAPASVSLPMKVSKSVSASMCPSVFASVFLSVCPYLCQHVFFWIRVRVSGIVCLHLFL